MYFDPYVWKDPATGRWVESSPRDCMTKRTMMPIAA